MNLRIFRSVMASVAAVAAITVSAATGQAPQIYPLDLVRPGQVGVGRTIFSGSEIEEFRVHILGVLHNITGPGRSLILTRLEGGPLANTGVISGMSGSPVYIDGRLVGAVSYSLGTFPKEALAGVTPIGEMTGALAGVPARAAAPELTLDWPATPAAVMQTITRALGGRATGEVVRDIRIDGPAALADLAPTLRPIGAAFTWAGFESTIDRELRDGLASGAPATESFRQAGGPTIPLEPGGAVGISLLRGDYELGATGTVTMVEGSRVFAFGHSFLNLGRTSLPMTRAQVFTVLPSLDASLKIAALGPVVGTLTHDRMVGVGGTLGAIPGEVEIALTIRGSSPEVITHRFFVARDQALTPLFGFVGVLNAVQAAGRQMGAMTVATSGTISFGGGDTVTFADRFTGEGAVSAAASAATAAVGIAATNEFRPAIAERIDLTFTLSNQTERATIERAWLDTTRVRPGSAPVLSVLLRDYRGGTETISMPVAIPERASGSLTLLVSDAVSLTTLEDRELRPATPDSWPALLERLNRARPNDRVYVRLLTDQKGIAVGGDNLPGLPPTIRSVFEVDKTRATSAVSRAVLGAWDHRVGRVVTGSREFTIAIESRVP